MIAAGYSAVVFDLDGTLADTAVDIRDALVAALATEGLPPISLESARLMIGGGPRLLVERALHQLGQVAADDLVARLTRAFHDAYTEQANRNTHLFTNVKSTLRELHATGISVGLCSNKPDDLCRMLLRNLNIEPYFDEVLGSGNGLPSKPDPAMLLAVIERLGATPQEALYVGDSETDVAAARAAGVPVMVVTTGYTLRSATQLGADGVLDTLGDLVQPGLLARSA